MQKYSTWTPEQRATGNRIRQRLAVAYPPIIYDHIGEAIDRSGEYVNKVMNDGARLSSDGLTAMLGKIEKAVASLESERAEIKEAA